MSLPNQHTCHHLLSTERISHHIDLAWMVFDINRVILQEFHPPPLPHVQILLREQILETLTIRKKVEVHTIKVVPLNLQSKNDY